MNDVLSTRNIHQNPSFKAAGLTEMQAMIVTAHLIRALQPQIIQSFLMLAMLQHQYTQSSSKNYPLNLFYAPLTENPNGDVASKREQTAARVRRASANVWRNYQTPRSSGFHGAEPRASTGPSYQAPPRTESRGSQQKHSGGGTDTTSDEARHIPPAKPTEEDYAALGVSSSASNEEIRSAYKKKARVMHPDKGGNEAAFKDMGAAYERVSNSRGFR